MDLATAFTFRVQISKVLCSRVIFSIFFFHGWIQSPSKMWIRILTETISQYIHEGIVASLSQSLVKIERNLKNQK